MFLLMKITFYLFAGLVYCTAYAAEKSVVGTVVQVDKDAAPLVVVDKGGQRVDTKSLIHEFTNTSTYSEKRDILNNLIGDKDFVEAVVDLLKGQGNLLFKAQTLRFLLKMREMNDLSKRDHVAILSKVIQNQSVHHGFLKPLALDQVASYVSEGDVGELGIEDSLVKEDIPMDFRLFLLREYLKKNICKKPITSATIKIVKNKLDIRIRYELLDLFFKNCNKHADFENAVTSLVIEPNLEWSLKERILLSHDQSQSRICSDTVLDHLLSFFSIKTNWHVRNAVIWMLSNVKAGCSGKVVTFFSDLVQKSSDGMLIELLDFRQTMVQSILWSLVRSGLINKDEHVVSELKKMAMKHDMNIYFRIRSIEALQDLSLYLGSAAQALYEIVRDNKRIPRSDFVTYDQKIRDEQDTKVRDSAFMSLVELLTENRSDFLSFLFVHREDLDSDQLYRRKAFIGQPIAGNLDVYARPALISLRDDEKIDTEIGGQSTNYREYATHILNNSQ